MSKNYQEFLSADLESHAIVFPSAEGAKQKNIRAARLEVKEIKRMAGGKERKWGSWGGRGSGNETHKHWTCKSTSPGQEKFPGSPVPGRS